MRHPLKHKFLYLPWVSM